MEYHSIGRNNNTITVFLPVRGNIGRDLSTDRASEVGVMIEGNISGIDR